MNDFYGVILGSETNALQQDKHGKLRFWDTPQEAEVWAAHQEGVWHIVPLSLETILRREGNLAALAVLELGHALRAILKQYPQLAEGEEGLEPEPVPDGFAGLHEAKDVPKAKKRRSKKGKPEKAEGAIGKTPRLQQGG